MNTLKKPEVIVSLFTCLIVIVISVYFFKRVTEFESASRENRDDIDTIARKIADSKLSDIATNRKDADTLFETVKRIDSSLVRVKEVLSDLQLQREEDQQVLFDYSENLQAVLKEVKEDIEIPTLEFETPQLQRNKQKSQRRNQRNYPNVNQHVSRNQRTRTQPQYQAPHPTYQVPQHTHQAPPSAHQLPPQHAHYSRYDDDESDEEDASAQLQNIRRSRARNIA